MLEVGVLVVGVGGVEGVEVVLVDVFLVFEVDV